MSKKSLQPFMIIKANVYYSKVSITVCAKSQILVLSYNNLGFLDQRVEKTWLKILQYKKHLARLLFCPTFSSQEPEYRKNTSSCAKFEQQCICIVKLLYSFFESNQSKKSRNENK